MKKLYLAKIFHKRFYPRSNEFTYPGFFIKFDIDRAEELGSALFGYNKFRAFSFYDRDHGNRDGSSLRDWAVSILKKAGISQYQGRIILQTFPRVFGHVFNPVSFWFCYDDAKGKESEVKAIICEVNNTFGESHSYVLTNKPLENIHYIDKEFHVSPFYDIEGFYRFDFKNQNRVAIDLYFEDKLQLCTFIHGKEVLWSSFELLKLLGKFPFYSFIVLFLIHYQALKLFLKKIQFYSKPEKSNKEVSYEHASKSS